VAGHRGWYQGGEQLEEPRKVHDSRSCGASESCGGSWTLCEVFWPERTDAMKRVFQKGYKGLRDRYLGGKEAVRYP
jgi:hypothetical protein